LINRIQAALGASDGLRRLIHFLAAKLLFSLPAGARRRIFAGNQHYCSICGSQLRAFLALHRPYHLWCPVCRSLQRHRLIWLMLQQRQLLDGSKPCRMLHIAPEEGLESNFRRIPGMVYLSGDLNNPRAMVKLDITNIQYPDSSFDFLLCSHVLEHVTDDRQAIREIWRVLSPGGWALILVPIMSEKTFEDPAITDPAERERVYSQFDHVRSYGLDFQDRLEQAEFRVSRVTTREIADHKDLGRLGLQDNETMFICEKKG
jgi:hypothetical protein